MLPFSIGTNSFIKNKFPGYHYDMYAGEIIVNSNEKVKTITEVNGRLQYNNYHFLSNSFYISLRIGLNEMQNKAIYKNLIKWYKNFMNVNYDKEFNKRSLIPESKKIDLKVKAIIFWS
ncbi:hypothetical protein [Mycoplasma sp. Mirounga ES2805-ORL]|uniref:hypothetical protein n=1 Tax=Mycoplasma sp. Mirounga ES2805-ORL TaxID=754514 RepID=UPI00197CA570|nr:hypothetical protein [Mycoplasma sp. Mirounga ES2805-ORL]QSF13851.1 hypothetical protein JXZ90_00930 [Mycoplasma sp. Mirounga ES2805-ORL]